MNENAMIVMEPGPAEPVVTEMTRETSEMAVPGSAPPAAPAVLPVKKVALPEGAEHEAEAREEYWNGVLTGDIMTIPRDVRQRAEAMYLPGTADRERVAACVMQSWVADIGHLSHEKIRQDWKEIRDRVARQYGASGRSDHELFVAVSQHNQVRLSQRETLFDLYQEAYDQALSGRDAVLDERRQAALDQWSDDLRGVASQIRSRALSDAMDDRNRLSDAAGMVRRGLEGLVANEARPGNGSPVLQANWKVVAGVPDVWRAVDCLGNLDERDRGKVFRMMEPYMRERPEFRECLEAALKRGAAELTENMAQLAANGAAWMMPEGEVKTTVDRYSRSFEELRRFARMEFAPLRGGKDAPWFREMLVDMAQQGASTALAFGGPVGIGALLADETGRHMADARQMNPDGVFDAQMGGAAMSGGVNTLLSVGMSRLGQRILGQGMRAFRSVRGGAGAALAGTGAMAADAVKMATENKLMELTPMLAQEGVGLATDRESGVDWQAWRERQLSPGDQMREAGMMMPFLLIGAGKASLHHFRNSRALMGDGAPLEAFGIPRETVASILQEPDVHRAGDLLQQALRESPLWGSLYISKKAVEWSRALDQAGEPFLKTEGEVRDFLELPSPVSARPWSMEDVPASAIEALSRLSPDPDYARVRTRWLLRAGLPRLDETVNESGRAVYGMEPPPGMPLKRTGGRSSREEALSSWYETLCRREEEDLGLGINRNGREIPWRLRNAQDYDAGADGSRLAFVNDRLKHMAYRPYKMLLLAHPESGRKGSPLSGRDWDDRTQQMTERVRANVYEGVMERVHGISHEEAAAHASQRFWLDFCLSEESVGQARRWLDEGIALLGEPDLGQMADTREGLASALARMSGLMAQMGDRERHAVSPELREMNRLVWGTQADVNGLFRILPNMREFDVCVSRGYTPVESYGRLLSRYLEIEPGQVAKHASVLDAERLASGPEQVAPKAYPGTERALENLSGITARLFQSSPTGDGQGNRLWRVQYPNGTWSNWHPSRDAAAADLMAHAAMIFSPSCMAKQDLIRGWQWHAGHGHPEWDPAWQRLTGSMENARGERMPCLYDSLSVMAVADMLKTGYGRRGSVGSGDVLEVTGRGRVAAEELMSRAALDERKAVYGRYVGEVGSLGVDADNRPESTAKGLVMHRLRLHNTANPLALIEDKAEVVWDRFLRTEQISPEGAWQMLQRMERVPLGKKLAGETELIEELSQLSKEYFLAHLEDESVPPTVAAWARYGAALPEHAPQPLEELARRASALKGGLDGEKVPPSFLGMLRETTGMNPQIRAERAWNAGGEEVRLPMMERCAHSLMTGRVLEAVPEHVRVDLIHRLAALDGENGASFRKSERAAQRRMDELALVMTEKPDLNMWRPDPDHPGMYQHLVRRPLAGRRGGAVARPGMFSLAGMSEPLPQPSLDAPRLLEEDFIVKRGVSAPSSWKNRPDMVRAVETLEAVRQDFSSRPEAVESGIMWKGKRYGKDYEPAPEGVAFGWERETPLEEAILLIDTLDRRQQDLRGGMLPFLPDPLEALSMYENCVLYRDPAEPGHTVRLMPGVPESPVRTAQAPYVVHAWNGVFLDEFGRPAASERDSYIPLERFHGAGEAPDESVSAACRKRLVQRVAETLSNAEAQKRDWWNAESAVSCFMEDVIRLYEELGLRQGFHEKRLDLFDPLMVQGLRFVSHALNDPLAFRLSLDRNTPSLKATTGEGTLLKQMLQEHEEL